MPTTTAHMFLRISTCLTTRVFSEATPSASTARTLILFSPRCKGMGSLNSMRLDGACFFTCRPRPVLSSSGWLLINISSRSIPCSSSTTPESAIEFASSVLPSWGEAIMMTGGFLAPCASWVNSSCSLFSFSPSSSASRLAFFRSCSSSCLAASS